MRDIFSELIADLDKDPSQSPPPEIEEEQSVALPEDARDYLPSHVWDKITGPGEPRKGLLLNALERVRSVLYLISTYLPQHIVQQKMRKPVCGQFQGQEASGTLLFSDVSGFTALSERLAVLGNEGAEQLTQIMNGYFENMLEILSWSGGILLKFAGDATLVYFPEQDENKQAQWAVRTGQRMMAAMGQFQKIETPLGSVGLKMKIGISTGPFLEAHVGSSDRMEYVVIGRTVKQTMAAEGTAEAGLVIIDEATAQHLDPSDFKDHAPGFYQVNQTGREELGDFEVKAESRRARGSIPWNANPHAIAAQMDVAVRQINALKPYLAGELIDNIVTNAKKRRIASEFRPTTVIFCNFIGFETFLDLWGRHGPRRVAKMLSQFFQASHEIIASYGGVVTRIDPYSSGSKMLILFGAPTAHEDDPQRAANAALEMQARMVDLNQQWQQRYSRQLSDIFEETDTNPRIQLKIGITHGRTFAGQVGAATRREYTVMGDDVNLSARLMSAAKPGQILLNAPVFDKIDDHFVTNKLDPIRVKGKTNPIPIFELVEKKSALTYQPIKSDTPIFGRSEELSTTKNAIQRASQSQGQYIQISGVAGIGKSHLISALYQQAQESAVQVLLTYCHSYTAQSAYAIWIKITRNLAGITDSEKQDSASEKLVALLSRLDMNTEEYTRPLANLLGLRIQVTPPKAPAPEAAPRPKPGGGSLFSSLGQKVSAQDGRSSLSLNLSRATEKQPDTKPARLWQRLEIQVASREKERLFKAIRHLLSQLASQQPLFLLFENAQWLDPSSQELLDFMGTKIQQVPLLLLSIHRDTTIEEDTKIDQIDLGPLSEEATAEFIHHLLPDQSDPNLIQAIHTQSNGNPLFIREMALWLQRNGQANKVAGGLMASMSIQELILSRVDNLPQAARETLKSAAIIGNEFETADLSALLLQQKSEYDLPKTLQELSAAQLITRNGDEFAFRQTLVREIVYNSQSFAKRRSSHQFLAGYLENRYTDTIEQHIEILAYHFEQAENWYRAGHYQLLAAHQARKRFAYPLALALYGRAMQLLTQLPQAERVGNVRDLMIKAHTGQGDMALQMGQVVTAAYAYQSAINLLTNSQQPIPTGLQIKYAQTLPVIGREKDSEAILRPLLAKPLPNKEETAAAATVAWLLWRSNNDEAKAWFKRARQRAEKLTNDGWAAGVLALLTEWEGDLEEALEAYKSFEQPSGIILTTSRLGDRSLNAGDFDKTQSHYQQANQAVEAADSHFQLGRSLILYRTAELEWRLGNSEEAVKKLKVALNKLPDWSSKEKETIMAAITLIESENTAPWPSWRWPSYEDAFRISLLFQNNFDTQFPESTI